MSSVVLCSIYLNSLCITLMPWWQSNCSEDNTAFEDVLRLVNPKLVTSCFHDHCLKDQNLRKAQRRICVRGSWVSESLYFVWSMLSLHKGRNCVEIGTAFIFFMFQLSVFLRFNFLKLVWKGRLCPIWCICKHLQNIWTVKLVQTLGTFINKEV